MEEYAQRQKEINQKYLCITDHGVMGAVPQQVKYGEKYDLNPIFGCEMYVNEMQPKVQNRYESAEFRKNLPEDQQKKFDKSSHLLGIAYTSQGYSNLVKLTSWAWIHGFYRKPRVNHDVLREFKEGIIFTTTCGNSEIANAFFNGGDEAGFQMLERYIEMFGPDHLYLELMMLDWVKQKPYDAFLIRAHQKYGLPLLLSQDCHYCKQEHSRNQQLMLMQQNRRTINEINALIESGEADDLFELQDKNLWLKSEDELNLKWEMDFSDIIDYELYKQAKANSVKICERTLGVEIDRSIKLPMIPNANAVLMEEIEKGLRERHCPNTEKYRARIQEEYELICGKGFASYFLIQKQMTDEARRVGPQILGFGDGSECVGPGRGCLSPDVPVIIGDGLNVPISQAKVGQQVRTIDGSLKDIEKVWEYDLVDESLLNIKTYYGDALGVSLTKDHKIYAEKQVRPDGWDKWSESTRKSRKKSKEPVGKLDWFRSDELSVGDWCFVPIPKTDCWKSYSLKLSENNSVSLKNGKKLWSDEQFIHNEFNAKRGRVHRVSERIWTLTKDWATVLGIFAGDGWTVHDGRKQVGFCSHRDEEVGLRFVQEVLSNGFGCDFSWEKIEKKQVTQLIVRSHYVRKLFDILHPNYAHTSHSKYVPDCILNAPEEIVWAYLHGYFLADGHEDENKIKFETVSLTLATQIRYLLLRVGLPSSLSYDDRKDPREEYKNRSRSYIVRCPLSEKIGTRRNFEKQYGWRNVKDGLLLKIREISEIEGCDKVYDLQVADNHNFLTSSFLVHNSACGSLVAYCLRLHDVEPIIHELKFSRFLSPARGGKQLRIRHTLKPIPHEEIQL